jgi:Arm DNA-binding domain
MPPTEPWSQAQNGDANTTTVSNAMRRTWPNRFSETQLDQPSSGRSQIETPTRCLTYRFRYTDPFRRQRDVKIGRHGDITADQARKRALELKAGVSLGSDPAGERDRCRCLPTFAAFMADRFLPDVRETVRSHSEYEAMARLRLVPTFGRLRLDQISPGHVAAFRREMIAEGLSNARVNRHLAVLRRAMNLALRWNLYDGRNPAQAPGCCARSRASCS